MKEAFKKKTFIAGIICVCLAIACVVISAITVPNNKMVSKVGKALEKKDEKKFVSCFAPEDQEEAALSYGLLYLDDSLEQLGSLLGGEEANDDVESLGDYKIVLLQGEETKNEDGTVSVPAKFVFYSDKLVIGDTISDFTVFEQDGKQYIK